MEIIVVDLVFKKRLKVLVIKSLVIVDTGSPLKKKFIETFENVFIWFMGNKEAVFETQ